MGEGSVMWQRPEPARGRLRCRLFLSQQKPNMFGKRCSMVGRRNISYLLDVIRGAVANHVSGWGVDGRYAPTNKGSCINQVPIGAWIEVTKDVRRCLLGRGKEKSKNVSLIWVRPSEEVFESAGGAQVSHSTCIVHRG